VFSVIALEAFVNEMTEHAQQMSAYQPTVEGPEVVLFAQVMGDAEEAHARLESKFTLANWILSGRNINRGGQPYQDFALLIRLRNTMANRVVSPSSASMNRRATTNSRPCRF
jgi:hypothetical protein